MLRSPPVTESGGMSGPRLQFACQSLSGTRKNHPDEKSWRTLSGPSSGVTRKRQALPLLSERWLYPLVPARSKAAAKRIVVAEGVMVAKRIVVGEGIVM